MVKDPETISGNILSYDIGSYTHTRQYTFLRQRILQSYQAAYFLMTEGTFIKYLYRVFTPSPSPRKKEKIYITMAITSLFFFCFLPDFGILCFVLDPTPKAHLLSSLKTLLLLSSSPSHPPPPRSI